jgi:glycosyltransferase involved in cell wall biosynthesis
MHFKIIIPLYNVEKWIKKCIRSVKLQEYKNFQCILIDDISTDNTKNIIENEIKNDNRFHLITNTEKSYALKNIFNAINYSNPNDNDIILTIDGDDWLASKSVLDVLIKYYEQDDCLMTYGSYIEYPNGNVGKFSKQIPNHVIDNNLYRNYEWSSSHLRTCKYLLWNKIDKKDFLDSNGQFYKITCDLAIMFPMLEMAGHRAKYVKEILYIYNVENVLNDHKLNNAEQIKIERKIRGKQKYNKLH